MAKRAYVLADALNGRSDVLLMATGSEISMCIDAYEQLKDEGIAARVVSMPLWEIFENQEEVYKDQVLPSDVVARVAVEKGSILGWTRHTGLGGQIIGMRTFGALAPLKELQRRFGFAPDTRLIGAVLINQLLTACFQRKNPKRRSWTIIDECGEFLTRDIALALDQTRKRGLRLILSHQHLGQLRKAGEEIESAVLNETGIRAVFRGLIPEDTRIFAEIMYRGFYDLQKLKTKLTRMQATGNTKERMLGGAESQNASRTVGENWSESEQSAENHSTTKSAGTARSVADSTSHSMTLASGETATQSESDTEQRDPSCEAKGGTAHTDGTSTATSESVAYTAGDSRSITNSASAAAAETDGMSIGRSTQRGGSVADTVGSATAASWSEAYRTDYQELPAGDTWSLEEQIHLRSVSLAGHVRQ